MTKFLAASLFLTTGISLALGDDADCFNSTFALLQAQLVDFTSGNTAEVKEYKMCSGTEIDIGFPDANFASFSGGDYPLVAARPNAIISCDGSCILRGGFVQFAAVPNLPAGENVVTGISIENVVVKGFKFTGNIFYDGAVSATIAAPGDITFEGCTWKDIDAKDVFIVGSNNLVPVVTDSTVEVTFRDSTFQNVKYEGTFARNEGQSLSFKHCVFDNIEATEAADCDCPYGRLFICHSGSSCAFTDNCLSNIMYGYALLTIDNDPNPAIFNVSNIFGDSVQRVEFNVSAGTCDLGLAINTLDGNNAYEECVDIFDASTCSLTPSMSPSTPVTTLMPTPMPTMKPTEPTSTGLSLGQQPKKVVLVGGFLLMMIM